MKTAAGLAVSACGAPVRPGVIPAQREETGSHGFPTGNRKVHRALEPVDLSGLERICERLPQLVPTAPSVLNHGDLWRRNLVVDAAGEPVFIDPAVCWTWAESVLSMIYCCDPPPEGFFRAYEEISPLADGRRDRMPLLHLREHLSVLAHFGPSGDTVAQVRGVVLTFA